MSTDTEAETEERAPDYPPINVTLVIPMDGSGVPFIEADTTCADWLLEAALEHLLNRMRNEAIQTELELTTNTEEEE